MDGFSLGLTTNTTSFFTTRTQIHSRSFTTSRKISTTQIFPPKNNKFVVFSSKEEPELDPLDLMELKFGRLIGEDPKLTLAKILGRKANPEATYMDIEKSFYKNKGKLVEIKEVPFDGAKEVQNVQSSSSLEGSNLVKSSSSLDGLNLVRPVPKKGVKFEVDVKPRVSEIKNVRRPVANPIERTKASVPNVILRKPSLYNVNDVEEMPSRLRIKPNLSLKMRQDQPKEQFSDMTLLRKPQPVIVDKDERSNNADRNVIGDAELEKWREEANDKVSGFTLLEKPKAFGSETKSEKDNQQFQSEERGAADYVEESSFTILEKPKALGSETKSDSDNEQFESKELDAADSVEDNSFTVFETPKAIGGETTSEYDNGHSESEESSATEDGEDNTVSLLQKPKAIGIERMSENENDKVQSEESSEDSNSFKELSGFSTTSNATRNTEGFKDGPGQKNESLIGFQPYEQASVDSSKEVSSVSELSNERMPVSPVDFSIETGLLGKPKRIDQPVKRAPVKESEGTLVESHNLVSTSSIEGHEDADWALAENLAKTGDTGDVELISASPRGFVVSFRSLIGFLPYRNLAFKWRFLAFESWLRRKGLDPSLYRRNLGVIGSLGVVNKNNLPNASLEDPDVVAKDEGEVSPDMKLDDLLRIYDQEKIKFLSSFIGQKINVNVVLANRKFGKLVFSVRPKEKEESVERKRSLMAKLQVGDVVKCCIKKITYFGVFVEVEGVPALIHQTEISWDATVDPSSYFKVGQIVEAKVYQLDFALERIFLSLKEIMPDPLMGALESVVGDRGSIDGRLEAAQPDTEWADVESLVKELQQTEGIQSVSKGRYFLSPGLAPTFQVYMASMFENQYKLLARSENKVQEVIVQTSLGKEKMKLVILACTSRVG